MLGVGDAEKEKKNKRIKKGFLRVLLHFSLIYLSKAGPSLSFMKKIT